MKVYYLYYVSKLYQFLSKFSLKHFLVEKLKSGISSWQMRLDIATGVEYVHVNKVMF